MPASLVAVRGTRWADPASVFAARFANAPDVFWLDAGPDAEAGWSWMGTGIPGDPAEVRDVGLTAALAPGAEGGRFRGGWVGWAAYDAAAAAAGAPADADAHTPHECWLAVDLMLAFDHAEHRVWVFAPDEKTARAEAETLARDPAPATAPGGEAAPVAVLARHSPAQYAELIERCRDAIREGDAYQLCLTTRFSVAGEIDPVAVYGRLRAATPAHHGGFIRTGAVALLSASPERFLEADGVTVRTRPIKGTRPRGADARLDAELAAELLASEKERAENVMIVDLMRNDLSRVCEPGSVGVDALLAVESYPAVHQLVSTVSGRLRADTSLTSLLDATFPAGSMTGAPKLSAMTILHGLERAPRGVFSGCFGWVGTDGALDLAMVIRSIVTHPGGAYVGAGGGITWRSDAAAEVAEVGVKARGPLAALGAALPPGW